jgi:2,3-bisphosphoglycerate-dependent phosphoglycerate mutase
MKQNKIEKYNTNQDKLILNEKIILSSEGEERAKLLSEKEELKNIDVVYASNCVRTLQTAKYLIEKQNLNVTIDDRLDERRVGIPNEEIYPDWFERQYKDENFKTVGGESMSDVRKRMDEAITEILLKHKDKRIAIFSHGYAITFYLLKYCKLTNLTDEKFTFEFNNKIIFDKRINAPEVFKLTFDNEELINIESIEFEDIPYNNGV